MQSSENFNLFYKDGHVERNLQISKVIDTDTNRIFPIPFKVMHIYLRYT